MRYSPRELAALAELDRLLAAHPELRGVAAAERLAALADVLAALDVEHEAPVVRRRA
mgnify:FL=1